MSRVSEHVKNWRKKSKERIVECMGGACQICGYDRHPNALEFHHLNPSEKEMSLASLRASPKSIDVVIEELKKCIMLCSNCHKEVHAGVTQIPENYFILDENKMRFPIRETKPNKGYVGKKSIDITNEELISLLYEKSMVEIGDMFDMTGKCVRNIFKRRGIDHKKNIE